MSLDYGFCWMMVLLRSIGLIVQLPVIAGRIEFSDAVGACAASSRDAGGSARSR